MIRKKEVWFTYRTCTPEMEHICDPYGDNMSCHDKV